MLILRNLLTKLLLRFVVIDGVGEPCQANRRLRVVSQDIIALPSAEEFDRDRSFAEAGRSIAASNWMCNSAGEGCAALRSGEHRVAVGWIKEQSGHSRPSAHDLIGQMGLVASRKLQERDTREYFGNCCITTRKQKPQWLRSLSARRDKESVKLLGQREGSIPLEALSARGRTCASGPTSEHRAIVH